MGGRGAESPLTWQAVEGKGPCWAAGEGQRVRQGRPRVRAAGLGLGPGPGPGLGQTCQDPHGNGGFRAGVGDGVPRAFLPGWVGPLAQQSFGGWWVGEA